jgi:type IV secretory pathway component VirB8
MQIFEYVVFIRKEKSTFFILKEVKLKSPDYKDVPQEEAVTDFMSRIQQYVKRYETIDDKTERNYSFIKIFNCGERFLVHKIGGNISNNVIVNNYFIYFRRSYSKSCCLFFDEYSCFTKNDLFNTSKFLKTM